MCPTFGCWRVSLRRSMMSWICGQTPRQLHPNSIETCNENRVRSSTSFLFRHAAGMALQSYLLPLRSMMGGVRGPRSRCGEGDDCFRSRLLSGRDRSLIAGEVLGNESISIFSSTFQLRCGRDAINLEASSFGRVCQFFEKRERKAVDSIDGH